MGGSQAEITPFVDTVQCQSIQTEGQVMALFMTVSMAFVLVCRSVVNRLNAYFIN